MRQTYQKAPVTQIYDAINKYILLTLAVSSLGLSRVVKLKGLNKNILLLFCNWRSIQFWLAYYLVVTCASGQQDSIKQISS